MKGGGVVLAGGHGNRGGGGGRKHGEKVNGGEECRLTQLSGGELGVTNC